MNTNIRTVFTQFNELTEALIDACSIVYAARIGVLPLLEETVKLHTLAEVIDEVGFYPRTMQVVALSKKKLSTDRKLIVYAKNNKLPVISEDKKILTALKKEAIPYFNVLMLLHFLLYKDILDQEKHAALCEDLTRFAHYGADIYRFSNEVCAAVKEIKGIV